MILGIAGLIATLLAAFGGVLLGDALQSRAERRLRIRETADLVTQTSLEALAYYTEVEAHITARAPEPAQLRVDLAADSFRNVARLRTFPLPIREAYGRLADRIRDAAPLQMDPDPDVRAGARNAVMTAIGELEGTVDAELGGSLGNDVWPWIRRR